MGLLFTAALVAALAVWLGRGLLARRRAGERRRALASRPGMSAERPLAIGSFEEIDEAIDTWRCPCGGPLDRIGEGSRPGVRVVRCACVVCEEDVDLFFDLSALRH